MWQCIGFTPLSRQLRLSTKCFDCESQLWHHPFRYDIWITLDDIPFGGTWLLGRSSTQFNCNGRTMAHSIVRVHYRLLFIAIGGIDLGSDCCFVQLSGRWTMGKRIANGFEWGKFVLNWPKVHSNRVATIHTHILCTVNAECSARTGTPWTNMLFALDEFDSIFFPFLLTSFQPNDASSEKSGGHDKSK